MPSREEWARSAANRLREAGIESARLDVELLLTHALQISRTKLHSSFELSVPEDIERILDAAIDLRTTRVPLAYIVGHKEFYGRLFHVSPAVLIPRPESEAFIELLKEEKRVGHILDVGTGSGALAITASKELNIIAVTGIDISGAALDVASLNAKAHDADIELVHGDLLSGVSRPKTSEPVIVLANLPYVDRTWDQSPELVFEPALALFADDDGLSLIAQLIQQAESMLHPGDALMLEADSRQHATITKIAGMHQFEHSGTSGLILRFVKI